MSKSNNIFEISNLKCKYKTNPYAVLEIKNLNIEKGAKVFFIGLSGVGKSTVLETLGIMNNTIHEPKENNTVFSYNNDAEEHENIVELWTKKDKRIARFRRKKLSFIFQNTNLFDSIKALDNISLAPTLQGFKRKDAVKNTVKIIRDLFKEEENLNEKQISEISGGQKQRIAFARAIASEYKVIFADEPTGNLDFFNANVVMKRLFKEFDNNNKTAIFVTHDIGLAINYATKIVVIKRRFRDGNKRKPYGFIDNSCLFDKNGVNGWKNLNEKIVNGSIENKLRESLISTETVNT
jgi:ABC-type lipoprotein export system ATPase subunit